MNRKLFKKRYFTLFIFIGFAVLWFRGPLPIVQGYSGSGNSGQLTSQTNADCLKCHSQAGFELTFTNGEKLPLTFDGMAFNQSVHKDMQCVECHAGYQKFPHPKITADSKREYSITFHDTCRQCHGEQFNQVADSAHEDLFKAGNIETPLCVDCHQPHQQSHMEVLSGTTESGDYSWASKICENCHQDQFESYTMSVHGEGLKSGVNGDLPTCINCHNIHDICNPIQAKFRKDSIDLCAKCHTDSEIMEKYGLETNVLDTYVVFHDTTVTLLEDFNPDSLTNKPTCYDCHGIHDVGNMTPPQIVANMPDGATYPTIEKASIAPPVENIGVTGVILGLILGSAGTLTIKQLVKEKKDEETADKDVQS
jgi:predicted CXXCH cytochrome family protein